MLKVKNLLVDYVFWITFILFSNPGGILKALGENSGDGGINLTDIFFVIMTCCYFIIHRSQTFFQDKAFQRILIGLFIFAIYYFVVFCFFVPQFKSNPFYDFVTTYVKARYALMSIVLVIFVYAFYLRSYIVFYKVLLISSIIVIILFFISVISGIDILPILRWRRHFIDVKRLVLTNYGLMPILIPMGVVVIIFKFDIKYKKLIILSFALMFVTWLLSIFRRYIFGTFIYFFVAAVLNNYINHKLLIPLKSLGKVFIILISLGVLIQFTFPEYINAAYVAGQETIHVIQYGETSTGIKDVRLGAGKEFMQNIAKNNIFFGTGFDNRWRSGAGDTEGYESSDYPFLGAVGMTGIVGLIFFLPVYLVLIQTLLFDIRYLRRNSLEHRSFILFALLLFIIYFLFDLMQYMNWFYPVSVMEVMNWYVFMSMYFATRRIYYNSKVKTVL